MTAVSYTHLFIDFPGFNAVKNAQHLFDSKLNSVYQRKNPDEGYIFSAYVSGWDQND